MTCLDDKKKSLEANEEISSIKTPEPFQEKGIFYNTFKRFFDFFISVIGLIALSPLFLIIYITIRLDSPGKATYSHNRLGKNGRVIKLYKFRTMVINSDEVFENFTPEQKEEFERDFKLENDPRITNAGKFLRKTSLDELPQLVNILKGELSLVGPRPVIEREIYKYGDKAEKFLSVTPGLTGYWQANGRSNTTYDERIEMDMYYIDNRSTIMDIKILVQTITSVFKGEGAH